MLTAKSWFNKAILLSLLLFLFCTSQVAFAQKEASYWYFHNQAGLRFKDNTVEALTDGKIFHNQRIFKEGTSAISDKEGDLLFYTDGISVWNKNHQQMPNGGNLDGHWSSTQSALIVPKPGSPHQYYIFTTDERSNISASNEGLRYSLVDMRLDDGRGDLVASSKNISLLPDSGEQLTAVRHSNGKDLWIIARNYLNNTLLAYHLSENGIAAPVESINGFKPQKVDYLGYLKASPDGLKLAQAFYGSKVIEIYSFNPTTGVASDAITLQANEFYNAYGVEFSPNGKLLYVSSGSSSEGGTPSRIYQLNLQASAIDMLSSKVLLLERPVSRQQNSVGALQLGPDGRIYVAKREDHLDVITNPNILGTGSNYVTNAIPLKGRTSEIGLPNFPPYLFLGCEELTLDLGPNKTLCFGEELVLDPKLPNARLIWSDGSTAPTLTVSAPGTYSVKATIQDCVLYDTITVDYLPSINVNLGPDLYFCATAPITLKAQEPDASYLWSDGSAQSTLAVTQPGLIWLEISKNGCTVRDTIHIKEREHPKVNLGGDRLICDGERLILDVTQPNMSYMWSDGSTNSSLSISQPGQYSVQVSNGCETVEETILVQTENCDCNLVLPNIFTPNNDGKNDYFVIPIHQNISDVNLSIYNRWGGKVMELKTAGSWDGVGAKDGVYYYLLTYECLQNANPTRKSTRGTITITR